MVRADGSSSTTRMVAIVVLSAEREENGEAGATPGRRLDLDAPAVRRHDAPGNGETEAGAGGLFGIERLEDPAQLLGRHSAAGIADGDDDLRLAEADRDAEAPASIHRLDAV